MEYTTVWYTYKEIDEQSNINVISVSLSKGEITHKTHMCKEVIYKWIHYKINLVLHYIITQCSKLTKD